MEVGPGTGALTRHLTILPGKELLSVELDTEAAEYLLEEGVLKREQLLQSDFLALDLTPYAGRSLWIVGNFPYNISSQILFRAYTHAGIVEGLTGMFQKEVAQRVAAGPGSKTYGILSVLLQALFRVEYLFTVNEGSFFPPPKVKSGVIRLTLDPSIPFPSDKECFTKVVRTAFNQRRKILRNALSSLLAPGTTLPPDLAGRRAEELSVADFHRIAVLLAPGR